jgi:hypothetical protein
MARVVAAQLSAPDRNVLRRRALAVLVGLAAFGLFGLTAGPLTGYENETAAVSEGLVKAGQLRVLQGTPLVAQGIIGRGGHSYGRAGLTQPLLEAPAYWLGEKLDELSPDGKSYRWRVTLLQLFDPAMAALTVMAIFALLCLRGVTDRRALLVATLCAIGTLIWPYSKIGMDTTLMAMLALAVLTAAWTASQPTAWRFALTGLAIALAVNSKAYGALLVLGTLPLLVSPIKKLAREHSCRVNRSGRRRLGSTYLVQLVPDRVCNELWRQLCVPAAACDAV